MKKHSKKIIQYSAVALAASAVLPMACKKDKEVDDPNITCVKIGFSFNASKYIIQY